MTKLTQFLVACLFFYAFAAHAQDAAAQRQALADGKYDFTLITPDMPERNREITVPAEIKKAKTGFEVHTQGMLGNKVTLKGAMNDGTIKMGTTAIEKNSILSFHYIGKVDKGIGKGEFFTFIDGKKAFAGKWTLSKQENASGK